MRQKTIIEECYINKENKCYCFQEDDEDCFTLNKCVSCSMEYAEHYLNHASRNTGESSKKIQNKDMQHSECFTCEHYQPSNKMWGDKCFKFDDYCNKAKYFCDKYRGEI